MFLPREANSSGEVLLLVENETLPTSACIYKVWDDDGNRDGIRPLSLEVTLYGDGDKDACRPIVLLQAHQSYRAHECRGGMGAMLQLAYRPVPGTLEFSLRDMFRTKYEGKADLKLPKGTWCHLAVQCA